MDQKLALKILLDGQSAFLTGSAGTGKTYLLNKFIQKAKQQGKMVSVTATTGIAATHLGGNTIHAWSGIGIRDYYHPDLVSKMSKSRREIIEKTDVLVIDEISMLHDYRLDMINDVLRQVRQNDSPFGGVQLVMSGDFFQLPPINHKNGREGGFVVNARSWTELDPAVLYLSRQYRQSEGALSDILTAIRNDDVRRNHAESLLERTEIVPPDDDITELHTRNVDVDKINQVKLDQIDDEAKTYIQVSSGPKKYVESLEKSILAPSELVLKLGALVMAVKNSMQKKYVNGSIGVVVDFEIGTEYPIVEFKNGKVVTMTPDSWELKDGEEVRATITQIPLRLAYAITVHKSQGMTLDAAKIDLRRSFVPGMGYVALSRVRDLNNLYLYGINNMALKVSPEALAIEKYLQDKCLQTQGNFKKLL